MTVLFFAVKESCERPLNLTTNIYRYTKGNNGKHFGRIRHIQHELYIYIQNYRTVGGFHINMQVLNGNKCPCTNTMQLCVHSLTQHHRNLKWILDWFTVFSKWLWQEPILRLSYLANPQGQNQMHPMYVKNMIWWWKEYKKRKDNLFKHLKLPRELTQIV